MMRSALLNSTWLRLLAILVAVSATGTLATAQGTEAKPAEKKAEAKPKDEVKPGAKPKGDAELYRLRRGDEVTISVTPQKEFDCGGVILPDGIIYLNNLGRIKADGMTIPEFEARVRALLEDELVSPRVRVALVRLAPFPPEAPPIEKPRGRVTIVGAVSRSGPLDMDGELRLRKALDLIGGTSPLADLSKISITHRDLKRQIVDLSTPAKVIDLTQNVVLLDGDSVEVPALPAAPVSLPNPVRIAGQVANPGQFELRQGMTLEDLIISAGKLSPIADVERIELRRLRQKPQYVDLVAKRKLGLDGKVFLEPGDEVYVAEMKDIVMLVGAVGSPGPRPLQQGQTIRDFFLHSTDASVLNPSNVNLGGVQLIRRSEKKPQKVELNQVLKKPQRKDNVVLKSGDIIFLPPRQERGRSIVEYLRDIPMMGILFGLF